jgi:hypothetical protein
VEETLQTLRYIIKSVFSDPQSAADICIVESNEKNISNPIKIEDSKIKRTVNLEDLNTKEEVEKEEVSIELLHVLVSALFHLSPLVQVGARETLQETSIALRQDMSSVLLPVKDFVTTMIEEKMFISSNNEGNCSGLNQSSFSGIMFCLSMGPSITMTNEFLIKALSAVLDVSEAEEVLCQSSSPLETVDTLSFLILTTLDYQTCGNEYQKSSLIDSPIKLDQSLIDMKIRSPSVNLNPTMIRRLLFTSLVRSLCVNAKASATTATTILASENEDVLQRCFSLLFKSLSSPSEQISICSHRSLQLLIALKTGDAPCITEKDYEALFPGYCNCSIYSDMIYPSNVSPSAEILNIFEEYFFLLFNPLFFFSRKLFNQCIEPILAPLSSSQYRQLSSSAIRGIGIYIHTYISIFLYINLITCFILYLIDTSEFISYILHSITFLASVFQLVGNETHSHYRDKILKHLTLFMDPEHLVSLQLWSSEEGSEEGIASGLLDLFRFLPFPTGENVVPVTEKRISPQLPSTDAQTFTCTLANIVIDLDLAWRQFRSSSAPSPFLPPFARFLSKHPEEVLIFFFSEERIVNHEVCI